MATRKWLGAFGALVVGTSLATSAAAITTTPSTDANALVGAIVGAGITFSNAALTGNSEAGSFAGGNASGLGFDTGIILTSGILGCVPGPNNQTGCTGGGNVTRLDFDFTTDTGNVFFQYVFGSEEYDEYSNSSFNDLFRLFVDGINIAILPGGAGVVEINNVNFVDNTAFYRDNRIGDESFAEGVVGPFDLQYDGLTVVLTASATGLAPGEHHMQFLIQDIGDSSLDSGVFINGGTFSSTAPPINDVPEPATLALFGFGAASLLALRRRRTA